MTMITIEDAQAKLPELIGGLAKGEELIITHDGEPIATLTRSERGLRPRQAGSAHDKILWISPDFDAPPEDERIESRSPRMAGFAKGMMTIAADDDEHLRDFAEYMP